MKLDQIIDRLKMVWNVHLSVPEKNEGDRINFLNDLGFCLIYGGVSFPEKSKLIALGFKTNRRNYLLPQGKGFSVLWMDSEIVNDDYTLISIVCDEQEYEDVFLSMIRDLLTLVFLHAENDSELDILGIVIERIRDWQNFLGKRKSRFLSREEEIGLWGELFVFKTLYDKGMSNDYILKGWIGPEVASKDFLLNNIGLEVKTFIGQNPSKIKINSLEQLDTEGYEKIFLICNGIEIVNDGGTSLPDLIVLIFDSLEEFDQRIIFQSKLLGFGYMENHEHQYITEFKLREQSIYQITDDFPSLVRSRIPKEITSAKYTLNLSEYKNMSYFDDIITSIGE